jgi:3-methylcrotonyl-CoA carboxylase alpha subunit
VIGSLLIANRGEIACRVIATAKRLGVRAIAVYSDADATAMHVRMADEAVHIGPSPARESYLDGDKIIEAARQTGAEAIHPGYGFLSENADFAQAVIDAGLIWVGPQPDSIRAMGLKDAAKKLMVDARVPVTPGYLGQDQSPARLNKEADAIGYPVLIKAIAGGGGKGMRRVNAGDEFEDMLESCKREATAAFDDDRVLLEKYIERPRHIEVQVFGDSQGDVIHLFERDCSLQRRHQKVIEEAPAPGMDEATRSAVCEAAVRAARAVNYVGAGTIEFIADASEGLRADRIWFMEMNTRLQVEHPVTEAITGQDLVEWQLRIASGEPLPRRQDELGIDGWAIEARLYAEDPAHDFLPSIGRLDHFELPDEIRVDTGVDEGDRISSWYDPMIAKLIAHAPSREEAIAALADAVGEVEVWPVRTNASFLAECLLHEAFGTREVDTSFIPSHLDALVPSGQPDDAIWNLAAAALGEAEFAPVVPAREADPWRSADGFRLNAAPDLRVALAHGADRRMIDLGVAEPIAEGSALIGDDEVLVFHRGQAFAFSTRGGAAGVSEHGVADGIITSPMPGRIIASEVKVGDPVSEGARLVTLEAMKMEHSLTAPFDGVVTELNAAEGAQVNEGDLLVRIEKAEAKTE